MGCARPYCMSVQNLHLHGFSVVYVMVMFSIQTWNQLTQNWKKNS